MLWKALTLAVVISVASANFLPYNIDLNALKRPTETNYAENTATQPTGNSAGYASPTQGANSVIVPSTNAPSVQAQEEPLIKLKFNIAKLRALLARPDVGTEGSITINVEDNSVLVDSPYHSPSDNTSRPTAVYSRYLSDPSNAGRSRLLADLLRILKAYPQS